ncbi:MAG TPA: hypothetical protein VFS00_32025, partial [Polyangiaceae bacterium]|nr:hypothetical protein [Polyangiaceae bacterium]
GTGGSGGTGTGGTGGSGTGGSGTGGSGTGGSGTGGSGGGSAENTNAACSDKIDNDGDTFVDCQDNSCRFFPVTGDVCPQAGEASDDECSDGQDNDGDTFVDCQDFSCSKSPLVTVCGGRFSGGVSGVGGQICTLASTAPEEESSAPLLTSVVGPAVAPEQASATKVSPPARPSGGAKTEPGGAGR